MLTPVLAARRQQVIITCRLQVAMPSLRLRVVRHVVASQVLAKVPRGMRNVWS